MATKNISIYARFYYGLRFYMHQNRWLLRSAQSLRAYLVLGPLRKTVVRYYQRYGNNVPSLTDSHPMFASLDVNRITNIIEEQGYCPIGILPESFVSRILEYCELNKRVSHWNPHVDCETIGFVARNAD